MVYIALAWTLIGAVLHVYSTIESIDRHEHSTFANIAALLTALILYSIVFRTLLRLV